MDFRKMGFEEVKEILDKSTISRYWADREAWLDITTRELCQLFEPSKLKYDTSVSGLTVPNEPKPLSEMSPKEKVEAGIKACRTKPDGGRLLNGEERTAIWRQYKHEHPDPELAKGGDFAHINRLLSVQRKLTASLVRQAKDAECRRKIERIKQELEKVLLLAPEGGSPYTYRLINENDYQKFWEREGK